MYKQKEINITHKRKNNNLEEICHRARQKFERVTTLYSQGNYSKHQLVKRVVMRQQTEIKRDFMKRKQASKIIPFQNLKLHEKQ